MSDPTFGISEPWSIAGEIRYFRGIKGGEIQTTNERSNHVMEALAFTDIVAVVSPSWNSSSSFIVVQREV